MAISLIVTYPTKVAAPTADYPYGVPRNVTVPSDGTGTPWEETWITDKEGFFQGLLSRSGITPSGSADTVLASQYHTALDTIYLNQLGTLRTNASVPVPGEGDRFPLNHKEGLLHTWVNSSSQVTQPGECRNFLNTHDMTLATPITKFLTQTWEAGTIEGGVASPVFLAPPALGTWYRHFLVMKPNGDTDVCWDTDPAAANFFLDPNAIAAGYSDPTLYRRIRWDRPVSAAGSIESFNDTSRPDFYTWKQVQIQHSSGNLNSSPRQAISCPDVPPSCFAVMNFYLNADDSCKVIITQLEQADTVPSSTNFTWRMANNSDSSGVIGEFRVDENQLIYARRTLTGGNIDVFNITTQGWFDPGISA